ncbi:hypothetical protein BDV96DRAFT_684852 [Lophiotrema nucula]|uniref:Uncharacterized protein n=1 Tax=Lophiotrema nucula TaxID=690887 RepID=A0A6A5ZGE8_9PLEO|nr:hypothetical protein BDV96DRAFT_684852 [Lophiotrema nucula]
MASENEADRHAKRLSWLRRQWTRVQRLFRRRNDRTHDTSNNNGTTNSSPSDPPPSSIADSRPTVAPGITVGQIIAVDETRSDPQMEHWARLARDGFDHQDTEVPSDSQPVHGSAPNTSAGSVDNLATRDRVAIGAATAFAGASERQVPKKKSPKEK